MKVLGVIPARFASSRFPGKPLVDILGTSMIIRVYNQVLQSKLIKDVIVATDDQRIFNHVNEHGGYAIMTSDQHQSGTDRIAEVAEKLIEYDIIVNIQGDEPFISPNALDDLVKVFTTHPATEIATLAQQIKSQSITNNFNEVKVVVSRTGKALYFSRYPIPFQRNESERPLNMRKHLGVYAFRRKVLIALSKLQPTSLELTESLEQLRWLENDYSIQIVETTDNSISVDTPEDLILLEKWLADQSSKTDQ